MNVFVISPKYMKQCQDNAIYLFIIAIDISFTVNTCCYKILSYMALHTRQQPRETSPGIPRL